MRCLSRSRRRTMFAPMRPSPMKPSSMALCLLEGGGQGALEGGEAGVRVWSEVDTHDRQLVVLDRASVANGLRVDQPAEGVCLTRDLEIFRVLTHKLEEPADRGAAFVQLAGGVEESRPVANRGGSVCLVSQQRPDCQQGGVAGRSLVNVGLDRGVAVGDELAQVGLEGGGGGYLVGHRQRGVLR